MYTRREWREDTVQGLEAGSLASLLAFGRKEGRTCKTISPQTRSRGSARGKGREMPDNNSLIMKLIAGHWWVKVVRLHMSHRTNGPDLSLISTAIMIVYSGCSLFHYSLFIVFLNSFGSLLEKSLWFSKLHMHLSKHVIQLIGTASVSLNGWKQCSLGSILHWLLSFPRNMMKNANWMNELSVTFCVSLWSKEMSGFPMISLFTSVYAAVEI